MGLREKVTLVLIAVVFYKTVCSLCVPLSLKENPFEKYLHKLKTGKNRPVSKYDQNQKGKRFQHDFQSSNVYKAYGFPQDDYHTDTSSKVDISGKLSSIDVLSDSALLSELRKEKRRKRKNKQTEITYSRDAVPTDTVPESFRNQETSFYFTEMGFFPEVQYPLTASDTWTQSYWNPSPSNAADAYFKKGDIIYQNNKQNKKKLETFLQPSAMKQNNGISKAKGEFSKIDIVNNVNKIEEYNKKILSEKLGTTLVKPNENNITMSRKQPQKLNDTKIQPKKLSASVTTKNKHKYLKKVISEPQITSNKDQNSSKNVISTGSSSRLKLMPKATQSRYKNNNTCSSVNTTTSCINSTKANAMDLTDKEMSVPNRDNIELPNDVELSETELEIKVPYELSNESYVDEHTDEVPIPSLTDKISTSGFEDLISKDNFKNDQSREAIPEFTFIDDLVYPVAVKNTSNVETVEESSEELIDSTLIETLNETLNNDITKLEILLADNATEPPIESYPAYPTNSITYLQSYEVSDYPVSSIDDSMRQRILEVLSTEKLSVSSLRENILKTLLAKDDIPSVFRLTTQLTDISANDEIPESLLIENSPRVGIFDLSLTDSPSIEFIDETLLYDNSSNNVIFESFSLPSEDILEFPITVNPFEFSEDIVADEFTVDSKGVVSETLLHEKCIDELTETTPRPISYDGSISESFVINKVDDIIPEEAKPISNHTIQVIPTASVDSTEAVAEPIVSEALANNLREIISNPSNSRALVDDLRHIIHLLTIWNSQIDDSDHAIDKTSRINANSDNSIEFARNSNSEIVFDTSVIELHNDDLIDLITDSKIVAETIAYENDSNEKTTTRPNKNIPDSLFNYENTLPESPTIDSNITFNSDNNTFVDSTAIIGNPITNENYNFIENSSTDSSETILDSPDSKNNIIIEEKLKFDSSEMVVNFKSNDSSNFPEKPVSDSFESDTGYPFGLNLDPAGQNNDAIAKKLTSDSYYQDSIANDKKALDKNSTTVSDDITSDLYDAETLAKKPMADSSAIISEPILTGMFPNEPMEDLSDIIENSSELAPESVSSIDKGIHNSSLEVNPDFELVKALSDELSEIISDNSINDTTPTEISSSEFSFLTVGEIISSLNYEKESDFPISFVSTYMPSSNETLISVHNEKNPSVTNLSASKNILEGDKDSFENICPIIDDTLFNNQCYLFEESDEFNSTSNLTDIVTGNILLACVDEPIDSLPSDHLSVKQQSDATLTDLIMGSKYVSNHMIGSQDIATSLNILDSDTPIADDEIPDFSDYTSSPEDGATSDFFENILFNNNSVFIDQINNEVSNMNDTTATDIVTDEYDRFSSPIEYKIYPEKAQINRDSYNSKATDSAQDEFDASYEFRTSTDDPLPQKTNIGISDESLQMT